MSFSATKKTTKHKHDGTVELNWDALPRDVPDFLRFAAHKAAFRLDIENTDTLDTVTIFAVRATIADRGNGLMGLSFCAVATDPPEWLAFAKNGTRLAVTAEPATDLDARFFPEDREDRLKILRTFVLHVKDRTFATWLKRHDHQDLIGSMEREPNGDVEAAVVEVMVRHIGADSRSDIVEQAVIADRATKLIRSYRSWLRSNA